MTEELFNAGTYLLDRQVTDGRGDRIALSGTGGEVTYAHKLTTDDRALDWRRPARELDRVVRALSPHIGARTALDGRPVTVWRARPLEHGPAPGQVADPLVVGTAEGGLRLLEIQPAGKRRMAADEYLRGLREPPQEAR